MTSYRVVPNDGNWKVMAGSSNSASHRTVSKHRLKRRAKQEANRRAVSGDSVAILKSGGAIQTRKTVR